MTKQFTQLREEISSSGETSVPEAIPPAAAAAAPAPAPQAADRPHPVRNFVLMVQASDLVQESKMLRATASTLESLKAVLCSKLAVEPPASGGVEVAKIVPGRKGATFIDSLDELPDKGKVQLWSSRDAAPSG